MFADRFCWLRSNFGLRLRQFLRAIWITRFSVASVALAFLVFCNLPPASDMFLDRLAEGFAFWAGYFALVGVAWMLPIYCGSRLALAARHEDIAGLRWAERAIPYFLVVLCLLAVLIGVVASDTNLATVSPDPVPVGEAPKRGAQEHLLTIWGAGCIFFATLVALMIWAAGRREVTAESYPIYSDTTQSFWRLFPKVRARSEPEKLPLALCAWVLIVFSFAAFFPYFLRPTTMGEMFPRAQLLPIVFGFSVAPLTWLGMWSLERRWPLVLLSVVVFAFATEMFSDRHVMRTVNLPNPIPNTTAAVTGSDKIKEVSKEVSDELKHDNSVCFPNDRNPALNRQPVAICPSGLVRNFSGSGLAVQTPPGCTRLQFSTAVAFWKSKNPCEADDDGDLHCPQPIIIAGAGGASRAAFFTGSVLGFVKDIADANPTEFRSFDNQLFALSSVSGSSLATSYFVALQRDAIQNGKRQPFTLQKINDDGQWFNASLPAANELPLSWKSRLQILIAGDFLTAPVASVAFRDLSPLGGVFNINDRARVHETVLEERFGGFFDVEEQENPVAAPLSQLRPTKDDWLPLLYLNASSVATGRRIIASPIDPELPDYRRNISCGKYDPYYEFYNDSYDLHDLINGTTGLNKRRSTDEERLLKRDVNLSTATLLTARFPVISPHGTLQNHNGERLDWAVDGGYFENYGATTAMDIADAIYMAETVNDPTVGRENACACQAKDKAVSCQKKFEACQQVLKDFSKIQEPQSDEAKIEEADALDCDGRLALCEAQHGDTRAQEFRSKPLIVQISNEPGVKGCRPEDDVFDPAARPDLAATQSKWFLAEPRSIADAILSARVARGTHASEFSSHFRDDHDEAYFSAYDRAKPGYAHFRVCGEALKKGPRGQSSVPASPEEKAKEVVSLKELSMSWWLSKPVQRYLDKQVCAPHNLQGTVDALLALSKKALTASDEDRCYLRKKYSVMVWVKTCGQPTRTRPDDPPCGSQSRLLGWNIPER